MLTASFPVLAAAQGTTHLTSAKVRISDLRLSPSRVFLSGIKQTESVTYC